MIAVTQAVNDRLDTLIFNYLLECIRIFFSTFNFKMIINFWHTPNCCFW